MLRHDEAKCAKLSYLIACRDLVTESGGMILILSVTFVGHTNEMNMEKRAAHHRRCSE